MRSLFSKRLLSLGMGAMLLFASLPSEAFCACDAGDSGCCAEMPEDTQGPGHCTTEAEAAEAAPETCRGCSPEAAQAPSTSPSIGASACRLLVGAGISIPDATVPSHEQSHRLGSSLVAVVIRPSTSGDALSLAPARARSTSPERNAPRTPARLLYSTLLI